MHIHGSLSLKNPMDVKTQKAKASVWYANSRAGKWKISLKWQGNDALSRVNAFNGVDWQPWPRLVALIVAHRYIIRRIGPLFRWLCVYGSGVRGGGGQTLRYSGYRHETVITAARKTPPLFASTAHRRNPKTRKKQICETFQFNSCERPC